MAATNRYVQICRTATRFFCHAITCPGTEIVWVLRAETLPFKANSTITIRFYKRSEMECPIFVIRIFWLCENPWSNFERILKNPVVISSKSIRNLIEPSMKTIKNKIIKEIKGKLLFVKVDAATRMNRSFLGINVQFIKDGIINMRTLSVYELTGAYIKDVILEVLELFEVKLHHVYTMTTDNGANMDKCIDLLKN